MRRVLLWVSLSAAIPALAGAQETSATEVLPFSPSLRFDHLGYPDGLPQSNVRTIIQDDQGFVWFGTQEGLARYDGYEMRVYRPDPDDPGSLSSGYVNALAIDPSGKIWVGTADQGISLYDPRTDRFTRYLHDPDDPSTPSSDGVVAIFRDQRDQIWFAMGGGGMDRFDRESGRIRRHDVPALDVGISAIAGDAQGRLWLGTGSEGLILYDPRDGSSVSFRHRPNDSHSLSSDSVTAVEVDRDGVVWVGTDNAGLNALEPETKRVTRYRHAPGEKSALSNDEVTSILADREGLLWVGTKNGLNFFQRDDQTFVQFQHDPGHAGSLSMRWVYSLFEDRAGVLWIGTFTGGVNKFDHLRLYFSHYRTPEPALSFFEEPNGVLWFGTYNGGLYRYDRRAQRATRYRRLGLPDDEAPLQLDGTWISAVHMDARGTLWLTPMGHGLVSFDPRSGKVEHYSTAEDPPAGVGADTIWGIWEDAQGALWLATWGGGLGRFDPRSKTFSSYPAGTAGGPSSDHLYTIYPDPVEQGVLWLGTAAGGLNRFHIATQEFTAFRHDPGNANSLSHDDILGIHRAPEGVVWVGTHGGGLNRLDPRTGEVKRYTTANSALSNDTIYAVLADADGKLWLSTNGGGLVHFDPGPETFLTYHFTDGLQSDEFAQGGYLRGRRGELIFGGINGFNIVSPEKIRPESSPPPIALTRFQVFNQEVALDRPIWTTPDLRVSYNDSFEFEFAALAFAEPSKNRFAYMLEGLDSDWIETNRRFATYTKLAGGTYTLRVRAANRHGVWSEEAIAIKVRVTPPFWKTWWAYGLYGLTLVGFVLGTVRYQRQKVLRLEKENRLAAVERDLELTGAVQVGFLPKENAITQGRFRLHGFYRPADTCSGDWWWFEEHDGRYSVVVGDVTGHGPGPAMVTAAVATAFRVQSDLGKATFEDKLKILNQEVLLVGEGRYHMTMCALEFDPATGQFIIYSAGGPPLLCLQQEGRPRALPCRGTPLGTPVPKTGRVDGQLEAGSRLFLYTDGLPEIPLREGGILGMRRLSRLFEQTRGMALADAVAFIVRECDQVRGTTPQEDDWTFAVMEWS